MADSHIAKVTRTLPAAAVVASHSIQDSRNREADGGSPRVSTDSHRSDNSNETKADVQGGGLNWYGVFQKHGRMTIGAQK